MTGGRVAAVRRYVEGDEPFLLTYGDGVADMDIARARSPSTGRTARSPRSRRSARPGRFGEMLHRRADRSPSSTRSPRPPSGFINGGFFVFDGRRSGTTSATDRRTDPRARAAAGAGAPTGSWSAFQHTGFWQPMDTLREYALLNELWAAGEAPWKIW